MAGALRRAPPVADRATAERRLADFLADKASDPSTASLASPCGSGPARELLLAIADHSPFLWRLATAEPARLLRLLSEDPNRRLESLLDEATGVCEHAADAQVVMRALRRARQETALLVAFADIGGIWTLVEVTAALTRFADMAVAAAVRFLLRQATLERKLVGIDGDAPETGSGLVVLALGKHGAGELNYSSDIDLIVLVDSDASALAPGIEPAPFYVRLTRGLVRLMQERTEDGYVLRVDLRLRPDPGSTATAISLAAAFTYYETVGQNWERAALIKARPVAGDLRLGERFLGELAPFIWRKYFDYAAIADIHAMKRQIHAVRGHARVTVAGHDVKLDRGGIREIEFFVQTQQLIFGGRRPALRGARTLDMLAELHRDGWVTEAARSELADAYIFLRTVEHRLQMVGDEQTQRLPAEPAQLDDFARFCGFDSLPDFAGTLTGHLRRVEAHYARLFEHAPGLAATAGSLVFTGVADDPETLETLRRLGFREPSRAAETVRGWHFGRRAAMRSARAREVLTELVPALLEAFSGSGDPDGALIAFDTALARLPAAVELFSLLKSNAAVRELFADILGAAPRLARIVAMRPHVLDGAIDPALMGPYDPRRLERRIGRALAQPGTTEEFLDRARDVRHEEGFLIGVRLLAGAIRPSDAAQAYSTLAGTVVRFTLQQVEHDFAREHGRVPDGRCAVLALGKLGSREMSAASDLDLILVYDFDERDPASDGAKPLHAVQYYARLTQRLVSALTVPTRRGPLYAVDLRLRPSGGKGPVATQFESFLFYQHSGAETWEHMALSRARPVAGDASLAVALEAAIRAVLAQPRNRARLAKDIRDMRALIARVKGAGGDFDLKIAPGGVIDVEFITQFLVLAHAHEHPALMQVAPQDILRAAREAGVIGRGEGEALAEAHRLMSDFVEMVGTCLEDDFDPATAPEGVQRKVAAALNLPDFRTVERELSEARARVRVIFAAMLGEDGEDASGL
ncbi:MAG: bifunctional [glutamine synthetase] adenylyltransferase/[glutamine synthetase]-adenylyl-L-tyrosine phosphorylase [Methylobacteriaceae bacterium]|nr:bifunctional [glutamine synthetase] adenylyltransferase/[glutamine synthetase]-adenylyl-L-tyrosine phosphorylase [Methylobacteriaceae bacterium]